MTKRPSFILLVALTVLILDQVSKYVVSSNLDLNQSWYPFAFLKSFFAITYIHNTGAAFGILQNQNLFFTIIAIVVICVILYYLRTTPQSAPLIAFSLGLQLGGAFGNLIDRITLGYVIDFIHVSYFAISNVADASISLGCALLAYHLIFRASRLAPADASSDRIANEQTPAGDQA